METELRRPPGPDGPGGANVAGGAMIIAVRRR